MPIGSTPEQEENNEQASAEKKKELNNRPKKETSEVNQDEPIDKVSQPDEEYEQIISLQAVVDEVVSEQKRIHQAQQRAKQRAQDTLDRLTGEGLDQLEKVARDSYREFRDLQESMSELQERYEISEYEPEMLYSRGLKAPDDFIDIDINSVTDIRTLLGKQKSIKDSSLGLYEQYYYLKELLPELGTQLCNKRLEQSPFKTKVEVSEKRDQLKEDRDRLYDEYWDLKTEKTFWEKATFGVYEDSERQEKLEQLEQRRQEKVAKRDELRFLQDPYLRTDEGEKRLQIRDLSSISERYFLEGQVTQNVDTIVSDKIASFFQNKVSRLPDKDIIATKQETASQEDITNLKKSISQRSCKRQLNLSAESVRKTTV